MKNFIEVHGKGKPCLVNVDNIFTVHTTERGITELVFNAPEINTSAEGGGVYSELKRGLVDESYDEIKQMIEEASK